MNRLLWPGLLRRRRGILLGGAAAAYADVVLADSPIAYWRFDEESGATELADASGNNRPMTWPLEPILGDPSLVSGDGFSVRTRSTVSDDPQRSYEAWMQLDSLSVELWFQLTAALPNQTKTLVAVYLGTTNAWSLVIRNTSWWARWGWRSDGGTESSFTAGDPSTVPAVDEIHHLVATRDGATGNMKLYLDGELFASGGGQAGATNFTSGEGGSLNLRNPNNDGSRLDVRRDEIAIYDYALSPERILAHYNAGIGA